VSTVPELLETNFTGLSINDFIVKLHHIADRLETHPAFKDEQPEYVTKSPRLRQMADELGKACDAAAGGDRDRSAEKKALLAAGQLGLSMNANHIVMLSLARNDPGILANCGYELKQRSGSKQVSNLLDLSPEVFAKHGSVSGVVIVLAKRKKSTASVELQMTDQDPTVETSWSSQGMYTKSRIELKGLEPTKRLHLRARYHEDGSAGRWSSPASIIVL
jgi:hypothetical protein